MQRAGHKPIGWVENNKFARISYQAIHDTQGEWTADDITTVTNESSRNRTYRRYLWRISVPGFLGCWKASRFQRY
ncbi:hypothetical protein [Brevibacillus laterosporus]|uniref:hypothetical protein n=1 Tax=Brevibacillus laterosporus TaxID=1465 RepID=UPI003D232636